MLDYIATVITSAIAVYTALIAGKYAQAKIRNLNAEAEAKEIENEIKRKALKKNEQDARD